MELGFIHQIILWWIFFYIFTEALKNSNLEFEELDI